MEAGSAERKSFALGGGGVEEARKPSERNAEGASVLQIDPEAVFVEANLRWAWQISHSMKPQCSVSLGGFGSGLAMVSLLRILPSRPCVINSPPPEFFSICREIGRASCRERVCQYV